MTRSAEANRAGLLDRRIMDQEESCTPGQARAGWPAARRRTYGKYDNPKTQNSLQLSATFQEPGESGASRSRSSTMTSAGWR